MDRLLAAITNNTDRDRVAVGVLETETGSFSELQVDGNKVEPEDYDAQGRFLYPGDVEDAMPEGHLSAWLACYLLLVKFHVPLPEVRRCCYLSPTRTLRRSRHQTPTSKSQTPTSKSRDLVGR